MPLIDLPRAELETYRPNVPEPADFDAFWQRTLAEAAAHPLDARFEPVADAIYRGVDVCDVTFRGWGGNPIRAWLILPADTPGPLPGLVTYVGYGGGRGLPVDHLAPAVAGFAHFVMDTRGQGATWSPGDTPDPVGGGPQHPGFLTRGIESPDTYYYRRVFTDAVRALEAAAAHPQVDPSRLGVMGSSQGGGIALAAAALAADRVRLLAADVPFLCHFRRALEVADTLPYVELTRYLACHRTRVEDLFRTLAYFDGVHFAPRVRARTLFSVALMDQTCPPSTVYAAYNRIRAPKAIRVYEYNNHEGGGSYQLIERLRFATQLL